jgi:hypothetical protein
MSFDRRLRDKLRDEATAIEPDVERHLGAVEARARRRSGVGAPTVVLAAAIVAAAVILRFLGGSGTGPVGRPAPSAQSSPSASPADQPSAAAAYPQIAGTYRITLDPTDTTVKKDGVGGTWTMQLLPDGEMVLSAPPAFRPGVGGPTGIAFSLAGDQVRTNLYIYNDICSSAAAGVYVWRLAAGRLSFSSVDETCAIRKTLLTTTPWLVSK